MGGDRTHAVLHHHKGEWKPLTAREAPRLLNWHAAYPFAPDAGLRPDDPPYAQVTGPDGRLTRITKLMDPAVAHGEYIGATLIDPAAAAPLADALEATWRRDPSLYYEDGYQEFADRGGVIGTAPIGEVEWVEVDNHDDLRRARQIAARCL